MKLFGSGFKKKKKDLYIYLDYLVNFSIFTNLIYLFIF